jgi:hypothetical protein
MASYQASGAELGWQLIHDQQIVEVWSNTWKWLHLCTAPAVGRNPDFLTLEG